MDRPQEPRLIHFTWRSSYGPDGPRKNHVITAVYSTGAWIERRYDGMSCADVRKRLAGMVP